MFMQERTKRNGTKEIINLIDEKMLQLGAYKSGKYSQERIIQTYHNNVDQHIKIFPKLVENNIKSFRLTSTLFPLFEFCADLAKNDYSLKNKLAYLGGLFHKNNIRVTCHPGQFTVISSDSDKVIQNSIRELEYHAWIFDQMGFDRTPYYAINIHGGKANRSQQLIDVIKSLPESVKNRLTLENDEKCYSINDLVQINNSVNIPIVFDSHHHNFNSANISVDDAYNIAISTWGKVKPLQHLSNTEPGKENAGFNDRRAHSQMIHYVPDFQLQYMQDDTVDIDVEAKSKNLAIFKLREDFNVKV